MAEGGGVMAMTTDRTEAGATEREVTEFDDPMPLAEWNDPVVQQVYAILCEDKEIPRGEHWEGFVARRIVAAVRASQPAAAVPKLPFSGVMRHDGDSPVVRVYFERPLTNEELCALSSMISGPCEDCVIQPAASPKEPE